MSARELRITPWKCPFCIGGQATADGDRCLHCSGSGLTDDPCGPAERAPRPPGVMRAACADCAYRPGSPEREALGTQLPEDEPFYCHQGLPVSATGAYVPVATFRGLPLGAMVCAGWWAARTGEQLPGRPYREVPITEDQVEQRWGSVPYAATGQQLTPDQIAALKASGILDQLPPGTHLTAAHVDRAVDELLDRAVDRLRQAETERTT